MRLLAALALMLAAALPCVADTLRIATFNTGLSRRGPGLLLRDITRGEDPQIAAVIQVIAEANADVIALQDIDWDHEGRALAALERRLALAGAPYPYRLALQPNAGRATGLDLDGDGRTGGPGDAQGYGSFTGKGGIAVLSRLPVRHADVRDYSALLWRDLPGALLPKAQDGTPFPSAQAQAVQRLSSTGHWVVPLDLADGQSLYLLTFQAAPPVFDGPEDRNGRRNHDEITLWRHILDGRIGTPPGPQFVIAGGANLDPDRSDGRRDAIRALLSDPRLQDVKPASPEGGTATVDWETAGRMRVDYVLPAAALTAAGAGVIWPGAPGDPAAAASRHRLVWADLSLDERRLRHDPPRDGAKGRGRY